jgi:DNA-directed RNA polymerase subunit beta'
MKNSLNVQAPFQAIRIRLASPERIILWGTTPQPKKNNVWRHTTVEKAETINYRTHKPVKNGLFCERIFGPIFDMECACTTVKKKKRREKHHGIRYFCPTCQVEFTQSSVRRYQMSTIQLSMPITHSWYLKSRPSPISTLTGFRPLLLELIDGGFVQVHESLFKRQDLLGNGRKVKNAIKRLRIHPLKPLFGKTERAQKLCSQRALRWVTESLEIYPTEQNKEFSRYLLTRTRKEGWFQTRAQQNNIKTLWGGDVHYYNHAEAIGYLLESANKPYNRYLEERIIRTTSCLPRVLQSFYIDEPRQSKLKRLKRQFKLQALRVRKNFVLGGVNPGWMIIHCLPVLPPTLRPLLQLSDDRFATSDLNDLYRRVLIRNKALEKLIEIDAPLTSCSFARGLVVKSVEVLFSNSKGRNAAVGRNARPLKSLIDNIKGKQGRFRWNLLGKRVDYSGRSVIVVGPSLQLHECGLPREMALELFQPFVIQKLLESKLTRTVRGAKLIIYYRIPIIWQLLLETVQSRLIFLNRAPSLHRLSVQAFVPVLIGGKAIRLHPLVCPPFNADFDGDQMAVHVPLAKSSQLEARTILLSTLNLVSPANGQPITAPSQDMILGFYYLTLQPLSEYYKFQQEPIFGNLKEALSWIYTKMPSPHLMLWVRMRVNMTIPNKKNRIYYACLLPYGNKTTLSHVGKNDFNSSSEKMGSYHRISVGRLLFSVHLSCCALSNRSDF